jgi:hypothetical protein
MGRTYKDGALRPGKKPEPQELPPTPARRERSALVAPNGSISLIDAPKAGPTL